MDALVLLSYFGIYGIWGLCGLREIHVLLFLSIMDFWAHDGIYQSMRVLTQVTLLDPLTTVDGGAPVWVKVVQFDLIAALKDCEGDWRVPFEKWMLQNCTDSCWNMQLSHDSATSASGVFIAPHRN